MLCVHLFCFRSDRLLSILLQDYLVHLFLYFSCQMSEYNNCALGFPRTTGTTSNVSVTKVRLVLCENKREDPESLLFVLVDALKGVVASN